MLSIEKKIEWVQGIRRDPETYMRKGLKVQHWWDGMTRMLDAIVKYDKVVVHSGHSLSKDYLGGRLPLWFLSAYYPARVIMTAPSDRQVKHIMWAELSNAYNEAGGKAVIGGELKSCLLDIEPNKHFALAFTTKETKGQTGKFQGLKAQNVLILVSEAQAVDDAIFEQIEGISTAHNTKIVLLGNPLSNTGFFARAIRDPKYGYHAVRLNCLDNPNYKEGREVVPGLASRKWCEDMLRKYGEDSAMYQGRVLGLVPDSSINTVIPYRLVEMAVEKPLTLETRSTRRIVSIDPASFGDDECVIKVMEEGKVLETAITGQQRTTVTAAQAALLRKKWEADGFIVDTVGEGRGVADHLIDVLEEEQVVEFKGSFEAVHKDDYYNLRAEAQFYAREQFEKGFCSIPDDPLLMEELSETKYVTKKGLYLLEDKDEIKERLGRSPNRADAYIMGLWGLRLIKKLKREKPSWKDEQGVKNRIRHLSPMAA